MYVTVIETYTFEDSCLVTKCVTDTQTVALNI